MLPSESEPSNGRILICRVIEEEDEGNEGNEDYGGYGDNDTMRTMAVERVPTTTTTTAAKQNTHSRRRLQLVTEHAVQGGCMALASYKGKIIAAVNGSLQVYDFNPSSLALSLLCSRSDAICITHLSVDEGEGTLAVGDILRSVSLYSVTAESICDNQLCQLQFIASEMTRRNITALCRVQGNPSHLWVGDANGNAAVMRLVEDRELDASNPQRHLQIHEWFHVDDQINRFVTASLFRGDRQSDGEEKRMDCKEIDNIGENGNDNEYGNDYVKSTIEFVTMFCTVAGRIGAIGEVKEDEFQLLKWIEQAMEKVGTFLYYD